MSLLAGRHTVTVTPKVAAGKNSVNGTIYVDGAPVDVQCSVQPIGSDEINDLDVQVKSIYRIIGRGVWPGGIGSTIHWNGIDFDQLGEPNIYSMSPRTAHYEFLMQSRTGAV